MRKRLYTSSPQGRGKITEEHSSSPLSKGRSTITHQILQKANDVSKIIPITRTQPTSSLLTITPNVIPTPAADSTASTKASLPEDLYDDMFYDLNQHKKQIKHFEESEKYKKLATAEQAKQAKELAKESTEANNTAGTKVHTACTTPTLKLHEKLHPELLEQQFICKSCKNIGMNASHKSDSLGVGNMYRITKVAGQTWTNVGAPNNNLGTIFKATGTSTGGANGTANKIGIGICGVCRQKEMKQFEQDQRVKAQSAMKQRLAKTVHKYKSTHAIDQKVETEAIETKETNRRTRNYSTTTTLSVHNDFQTFYDNDVHTTATTYSDYSTKSAWEDVSWSSKMTKLYRARKINVLAGPVVEFQDNAKGVQLRQKWTEKIGEINLAGNWYKEKYIVASKQWECRPWNDYEEKALHNYQTETKHTNASYSEVVYSDIGPIGWYNFGSSKSSSHTDLLLYDKKHTQHSNLYDLGHFESTLALHSDSNHNVLNVNELSMLPSGSEATWTSPKKKNHNSNDELDDNYYDNDPYTQPSYLTTPQNNNSSGVSRDVNVSVYATTIETTNLSGEIGNYNNNNNNFKNANVGDATDTSIGGKTPWMVTQRQKELRRRRRTIRNRNKVMNHHSKNNDKKNSNKIDTDDQEEKNLDEWSKEEKERKEKLKKTFQNKNDTPLEGKRTSLTDQIQALHDQEEKVQKDKEKKAEQKEKKEQDKLRQKLEVEKQKK